MAAVALVVAAGAGRRLGAPVPKALQPCAGRPLVAWSVDALLGASAVAAVVVAVPPGIESEGVPGWVPAPGVRLVAGGASRSASVRNALAASEGDPVLVHDAARPLVTAALADRCVEALEGWDGAIAAARMSDTVKEAGEDYGVVATLDRSRLWAVQTPQVFTRAALSRALDVDAQSLAAATDDASLVERAGGRVRVVEAPRWNVKVTEPADLEVAEARLAAC